MVRNDSEAHLRAKEDQFIGELWLLCQRMRVGYARRVMKNTAGEAIAYSLNNV